MQEVELAKERLKGFVMQYLLVSKIIIKNKPIIDKPDKTAEEAIKCDKLARAFENSSDELLREFDKFFDLEVKYNLPVNFNYRSHYKKLKAAKNKII